MIVIVGTGAGGAILARELALNKMPVTILEKGPYAIEMNMYSARTCHLTAAEYTLISSCISSSVPYLQIFSLSD